MNAPAKDSPRIIGLPPLIFAACLGLGLGLHWLHPIPLSPRVPLRVAGIFLLVVAAAISLSALAIMRTAGTNVRPDRPSTAVVTSGSFRFTRNPLYLSLCLLHAGIALVVGGLAPLLLTLALAIILHLGVILPEEEYLEAKFGTVYSGYCSRVRRWL